MKLIGLCLVLLILAGSTFAQQSDRRCQRFVSGIHPRCVPVLNLCYPGWLLLADRSPRQLP
jgi:hypothetical protein